MNTIALHYTQVFSLKNTSLFCVGTLCCLLISYVYLLSATVMHVVIHKEITQDTKALHSEISALEATFIAQQHTVSEAIANLDGYVPIERKVFIDQNAGTLVLQTPPSRE